MTFFEASNFSGLIFDCDGTLTDSMPLHYQAWSAALGQFGIAFPEDRFYSLGGMPSEKIVDMLSKESNVVIDPETFSEMKENMFLERLSELKPLESVCEIARANHQKIPMAVASGGTFDVIKKQLIHVAMYEYFDTYVCAEDTEKHKPEPDVFLEAARRINIEPSQCCVFEDSPLGIEAAAAAGMACIDIREMSEGQFFVLK